MEEASRPGKGTLGILGGNGDRYLMLVEKAGGHRLGT